MLSFLVAPISSSTYAKDLVMGPFPCSQEKISFSDFLKRRAYTAHPH